MSRIMSSLTQELVPVIQAAGEAALRIYRTPFAVERKQDGTQVTAADKEAEAIILKGLSQIAPEIPVIAEESFSQQRVGSAEARPMDRFFLVDPIDGTADFINQTGEFTVNIALIERARPVLGLIYAPFYDTLWMGGPGFQTALRLDGLTSEPSPSLDQAISIRARKIPPDNRTALISHSTKARRLWQLLDHHKATKINRLGSSLKFCHLAEGRGDVYVRLGRTMLWDTAAGQAILEAAGGCVLVLEGGDQTEGDDIMTSRDCPLTYDSMQGNFENPDFIAWARR